MFKRSRTTWQVAGLLVAAYALAGCVASAVATGASVGVLHVELEKERFNQQLSAAAQDYLKDHANSPCTQGEDRVMPSLLEEIRRQGRRNGVEKALTRLNTIYEDTSYEDSVRASALYHQAVLYLRKDPPNHYLGIETLRKLNDEFPGTYDCIFEDTPWRDEMIRKLGIPEELLTEEA